MIRCEMAQRAEQYCRANSPVPISTVQTSLSVILCTHNPRPEYLSRVLESLPAQTLSAKQREFLLVDNASGQPVAETWDISWHSCGRHFREEQLAQREKKHRREGSRQGLAAIDA
jgi:hypothetical protein